MNIFNRTRVLFTQLQNDVQDYLIRTYNQAREQYTPASPFGQIIEVLNGLFSMTLFYVEDAITELNIFTANRPSSIFGWSRLNGHNPTRAQSAKGEISIKLKQEALPDINGSFISLPNFSRFRNLDTALEYSVIAEQDNIKLNVNSVDQVRIIVQQGVIESQSFVGDGEELQSFNVQGQRGRFIDNDYVRVRVNGTLYDNVDSLYDMAPNGTQCIVRTGLNDGIDIFFGNGIFGLIPDIGANIQVEYLNTQGNAGNLGKNGEFALEWIDPAIDNLGNEVDLNDSAITTIELRPLFGANQEPIEFTQLIATGASRSLVLANPDNYIYYFQRLGLFSVVDAYTTFDDDFLDDDNIIYVFLIPDVRNSLTTDANYFTTNINNFFLDQIEKDRLLAAVNQSGQQIVTTELRLVEPIVKRYVVNIVLRVFEGFNLDNLREEIISQLNDYFLETRRRDKIPASDIVRIVDGIDYVDSVNVNFLSEENEEAIINGFYFVNETVSGSIDQTQRKITLADGEDPNLGLDEFGDIVIGRDELTIIRGGWADRNGQNYEETPNKMKPSSVNIIIRDTVPRNLNAIINNG